MKQKTILILWDASHIWGLMAYRGIQALGLPCRLVKAIEITQGSLLGKQDAPSDAILLVPGGNARLKANALGQRGLEKIRAWVAAGGLYLGFCGGAGLALSGTASSLGLCPLRRARFQKRFYHFLSGHVLARTETGLSLSLPVWWPGRFEVDDKADFSILARYAAPGPDLWLADLPLAKLPREILASWTRTRDLDPQLGFPAGEPLLIQGEFGKGAYILSYSHLETPNSAEANQQLASLLKEAGASSPSSTLIPEWVTVRELADGRQSENKFHERLQEAQGEMLRLCASGLELGLLFPRKEWLLGWRSGFSGMPCNNLLASLAFLLEKRLPPPSPDFQRDFERIFTIFIKKATEWIWSWKLDSALSPTASPLINDNLAKKQLEIFGNPMSGGGLLEQLLNMLDEHIRSVLPESE